MSLKWQHLHDTEFQLELARYKLIRAQERVDQLEAQRRKLQDELGITYYEGGEHGQEDR